MLGLDIFMTQPCYNPVRLAGLAAPTPWRRPGTQTAGAIPAGIARILRSGRPAHLHRGNVGKNPRQCKTLRRSITADGRQSGVDNQNGRYRSARVTPCRGYGEEMLPASFRRSFDPAETSAATLNALIDLACCVA
jgi:hypothetical protein